MTTVVIGKSPEGAYKRILCMGHAGYQKKRLFGKADEYDVLCASISVLVLNTVNALEELGNETFTTVANEKDGFIRCDFSEKLQKKSEFLLDAMVYGLENLKKQYGGKYLQVNYEEV